MAKLIKRAQQEGGEPAEQPAPDGAAAPDASSETPTGVQEPADIQAARVDADSLLAKAREEAAELVAAAQQEAAEVVAAAHDSVVAARAEATGAGHAAGREEGMAALMAQVVALGEQREQLKNAFAPDIVTLAMAIARRILGRELEFAPETVVDIVKQALADKARQRREITLRLHPNDAAIVREQRSKLVELLSRSKEIAIQEDADVAPHGVVIETEAGSIDAQLEVQLAAIEAALRQVEQEGH